MKVLPGLAEALAEQVPPGVVLDGEAVIWNRDRLDFEALQQRMVAFRAALPALGLGGARPLDRCKEKHRPTLPAALESTSARAVA
ncbi:hypothetical protein [Pseudarthrobacter sp. NCCP-2145]|uniref:hypothetical protein n=1 Tax=Pseudarthrobacter sp. NCCP-2145 TaxID=2942290 RepID=UPI00203CAF63|nr:hypothetical protein [Pseudarthrobacter sp. NCCP-2145]GKV72013.1 hypothetical protein NCCP2145_13940 [Pseudarthrobacter sp. NCCP-2145]